jgi:hypothetical protein
VGRAIACSVCVAAAALISTLAAAPAAAYHAEPIPRLPVIIDEPRPTDAPSTAVAPTNAPTAVVASWFGPGLWGNRTACGQTLTSELVGVAHRSLPCGSLVTLRYGDSTVVVPVVDRGPFHSAREFDLTYATKTALACRDLCSLFWMR